MWASVLLPRRMVLVPVPGPAKKMSRLVRPSTEKPKWPGPALFQFAAFSMSCAAAICAALRPEKPVSGSAG